MTDKEPSASFQHPNHHQPALSTSGVLYKKIHFSSPVPKIFQQTQSLIGWSNRGTMNDVVNYIQTRNQQSTCLSLQIYHSLIYFKDPTTFLVDVYIMSTMLFEVVHCIHFYFLKIASFRFAVTVMKRCAMETVWNLTTSCMRWYEDMMI